MMIGRLNALFEGLTQEQVAQKVGVTRQAIGQILKGAVQPSLKMLIGICESFNVSADYLLGINRNTDFTDLQSLIADINTTEIASHLNNMDEWTAKWRAEAEKALYKISEDYLK